MQDQKKIVRWRTGISDSTHRLWERPGATLITVPAASPCNDFQTTRGGLGGQITDPLVVGFE